MNRLKELNERIRSWMLLHADTPQAQFWLSVISFLEASLVPLPPSVFMLAMVALSERKRWVYLATLTTVMSVLGGVFGYLIGSVLFDTLGSWVIEQYNLADEIAYIGGLFEDHAFLAVFVGAFTPIPYKAFTIASGFFSLNILTFIVSSTLGRGLRFYAVAYIAHVFGEHVAGKIFHYFALATLSAVIILILASFVQLL